VGERKEFSTIPWKTLKGRTLTICASKRRTLHKIFWCWRRKWV